MMAGAGRRCVMRIVCIAQADIAAVATMLVGKLTELLSELCDAKRRDLEALMRLEGPA